MEFSIVNALMGFATYWLGVYLGRKFLINELKRDKVITEVNGEYYPYQSLSKTLWTHDPDDLP